MSIEVSKISDMQLAQILSIQESHFADLKSIDVSPGKLSQAISAFANASGGELYIGIKEIKTGDTKVRLWQGFHNQEGANAHIEVFERLFPLGQYYQYNFLVHPNSLGLVLQVVIQKSKEIVKSSDGTIYIRRNAQNMPLKTDDELRRLRLDKGIQSFERETVDVDVSFVSNSATISEFIKNVIPSTSPERWLTKQLLIYQGKPTVAGVLLFSDEPQAILPKHSGVKIYRYGTTAAEGTRDNLIFDPITVEGCLYEQIKKAVAKTIEIIEGIPKLGQQGLEKIQYPEETIHEILTNAVLHRDYSILSDIHVRIFNNRIEIENPGKLPGHITPENILREQFARNGTLVRLINKFPDPPNKDVGEGLNTAFQAMSKLERIAKRLSQK